MFPDTRFRPDIVYVTMLTREFAVRFLLLYQSMLRHCGENWLLVAVALDEKAERILAEHNLQRVVVVKLEDVLLHDMELLDSKNDGRTIFGFYYCAKPSIMLYAMSLVKARTFVFVDADVYFFSSPSKVLSAGDIVLVSHCFARDREGQNARAGKTDAGFVVVGGANAELALIWWKSKCMCKTERLYELGYLESFCGMFGAVYVEDPSIGTAFFNTEGHVIGPGPKIDGKPIVYAHFTGWERNILGDHCPCIAEWPDSVGLVEHLLVVYAEAYRRKEDEMRQRYPWWKDGLSEFPAGCEMILTIEPNRKHWDASKEPMVEVGNRWCYIWGKYGGWHDCRIYPPKKATKKKVALVGPMIKAKRKPKQPPPDPHAGCRKMRKDWMKSLGIPF